MKIRILSSKDIKQLLSMPQAIDLMRVAFAELTQNRVIVPLRTITEFEQPQLNVFYKPCYSTKTNVVGVKLLTQTKAGIVSPTIQGINILMDANTGCFLAIIDGTYLTALRTGATSGLATDLLARKDAQVAAIFGAGAQGRTQLEAICSVRKIERAFIFDTNKNAVENYIAEMKHCLGETTLVAGENVQQLREADVICTATSTSKPLFSFADVKKGAHINAVGSYKPYMQEIDAQIMKEGHLYVDQKSACIAEAGDLIQPMKEGLLREEDIIAELGELVTGRSLCRQNEQAITVFKSVGIAIQDLVAAHAVYQKAVVQNTGVLVDI